MINRRFQLSDFLNQNNSAIRIKNERYYNEEAIKHEMHDAPGRKLRIKEGIYIKQ